MQMPQVLNKIFGKELPKDGELRSVDDQSAIEKELASYVRQRVEEVRMTPGRVAHEATWMVNTAYLLGYDQVYYDSNSKQFRSMSNGARPLQRTRIHVNTILPTVQNRLARMAKNPPKYDVRPNSPKAEDKDAARLSQQVLTQLWEQLKVNLKRISLYMWIQQCGYAFFKTSWDECAGNEITSPMTGEIDYEGDVRAEIASAFEIFCDPLCKDDFEEAQWLVHARVRKLDYFRTHFPERGHLVKEEDAWLLSIQYEQRINTITPQAPFSGSQAYLMKNAAIELAYYEKRSRKFPKGRFVVVASGVVLWDKELPIDEIPYSKFDDIIIGGKFDSEAIITHLRPLNDQFNKIVSKRSDFFNKMMAGKLIAPRGSKISQEAPNDESGEILEFNYKPGNPIPQQFPIPQIPAYAYEETKEFKEMHYDISGIGEISRGSLPSAGIPAIGMQFLEEQESTRLSIEVTQHEFAWARVGRHILKFVNKYYKTERLLKMSGQNQDYIVKSFKGEDLRNHFDVIVIPGSTLPGSKILRRQEILNAYDRGLIGMPGDPKTLEKLLGMLEYGDVGEVWEDYSLDMKMIRAIIKMIEEGQVPDSHELDNHLLIIQELNRYRKSDKYDNLTPEQKALFWGVVEWHVQAQMRIQNPELAAQETLEQEAGVVEDQMLQNPQFYEQMLRSEEKMNEAETLGTEEMAMMDQMAAEAPQGEPVQ